MKKPTKAMAEAVWKIMYEREMSLEDILDVCAMLLYGVSKHAPASIEEIGFRMDDKLSAIASIEPISKLP